MAGLITLDDMSDDERSMLFQKNNAVDLLPSEEEAIYKCILAERESYECKSSFHSAQTMNELMTAVRGFAHRLQNRIAEVGFRAIVSMDLSDPDNYDMYEGDVIEWHPSVLIDSRISGSNDIDHDKKAYEVKHGLADGKVGRYDINNVWHDDPDARKLL